MLSHLFVCCTGVVLVRQRRRKTRVGQVSLVSSVSTSIELSVKNGVEFMLHLCSGIFKHFLLGKNFSSSDTSAYLEVVRENTWEVIRNLEATRLFGMLPKPVLNWSESQIPGIKNVPPSNNAMAIFMADLRNFLWKQQQELAADLSKQKTGAPY